MVSSLKNISSRNDPDSSGGRILLHGTFVGFVKDNVDTQCMGRLAVWIPEIGGDPNNPKSWIIVGYASMFGGATDPTKLVQGNQTMSGTQTSYGWWGVPPDLNNQVLVTFVNGDTARGYWFACVFQQNMNQMVPGIAAAPTSEQGYLASSPTVEYNKTDSQQNTNSPTRPVFTPLANGLNTQGLGTDPLRGPTTASARRSPVSNVYGISSPRAHQIYIDDDTGNEYIRIRTRSGAQVLVNDTTGFVYINSKSGNSWLEISDDGVDVYSKNSVSIRAEKDFNVRADNNIIFDAGGSIYMRAGSDINLQSGKNFVAGIGGDLTISVDGAANLSVTGDFRTSVVESIVTEAGQDFSVKSGTNITMGSDSDVSISGSGTMILQASMIQENPGSAPSPSSVSYTDAQVPTPGTAPDVQNGQSSTIKTIVNRLPTHEPWAVHPTGGSSVSNPGTSYSGISQSSSGGGSSSGVGGAGTTTTPGSTPGTTTINGTNIANAGSSSSLNSTKQITLPGTNSQPSQDTLNSLSPQANAIVNQYAGNGPYASATSNKGQCVALVQVATGVGLSSGWTPGAAVSAANANDIPAGTPIATFPNGSNYSGHTAIYLGPGTTANGQPGITVLDQWAGQQPTSPAVRVLPFSSNDPINGGNHFNVVQSH